MNFTKMQGLGNDFIVINNLKKDINLSHKDIIRLCDRKLGIGADGLILVNQSDKYDIKMTYYNRDGSEVEMCGNGVRCFAKYCYDREIIKNDIIEVETLAGKIVTKILSKDNKAKDIRVNMGIPVFSAKNVPILINKDEVIDEIITYKEKSIKFSCTSMGNPHVVIQVDNIEHYPKAEIGSFIEKHPLFPQKTNVNFVEVIDSRNIKVTTWERGVGLTLACGTGVCATASVLYRKKITNNSVYVKVPGGSMFIDIEKNIFMTGPAEEVFNGYIHNI